MAQTKRDLEQLVTAAKQSATKAKDTQTAYNSFLTNVIRNYDGNIPYSVDARTTDFQNAASTGSLNDATLNALLGNEPGDWRPKRGDKADKNILRETLLTKNAFVDYARQNGVFDTEQYAFDPASVVMPSTPYLQQLYDTMSDPAYKAKATTQDLSKMNRSSWGWFYDGLRNGDIGLSTQIANISQPGDDLLAYTDHLITGNQYVDPETMTEEERNAWRTAALERYNYVGLGNEQTWIDLSNGTYSFDSPRGYDRNMDIVSQELARRQRVSDLTAAAQALPDFETRSVYHSPYESSAFNPVDGFGGFGDVASYVFGQHHTDDLQWLINNPPAYLGEFAGAYEDFFEKGYNLLDEEDKKIYNVLMDEDPEMAAAFLEAIGPDLLSGRRQIDKWYNSAIASGPVTGPLSFVAAAIGNVGESFRYGFTAAGLAVGSVPEDPNDPYYDNLNSISDIRTEQRDIFGDALNFEIAGHRVGDFLYDTLTGVTDFGLAVAVSSFTGNPSLAGYIMGSEAGASTTHEMLKNGWDGKAAATAGLFSAAVEAFTEKFSIDALFKNPTAGWKYFLSNAFVEGTEEAAAEILNPVAEAFTGYFFGEETNAQARYYDLVNNQGMTDAEASRVLFNEFMNSTAYAAAIGAAVGGVAAGGTSVVQNQLDTRTGQPIAASETGEADLLSLAETMPDNSETKKILPTLKKTKGGKNVKASELGRLARTMAAELDGESHSVLASATASVVRQHLNATGRAQDIHTAAQEVGTTPKVLAETIAKGVNGTRMNAEERRIFGKSDFAKSMVRELGLDLKAPTMIKQARLRSITNPTALVEERRENAAVVRATQLINPASNDPHSDHLVYEVDGRQAEGDILRFDEVDGELHVVVKDGDGNRATLSRDMITSMDGSTQATVVELVTSGGERISAPKANLMLRAAQYEKPESMASFLTAFDSVYDAGWYGRSMEAVDGLSSDLAERVYTLGQNEAKMAEEARVTRDGAFKRVEGGLVTFLGKVKTREELVGEGTVDALTAAEGSLTETQRAHVEGIKAIAKAINAQIVLYESDADSISDLPNGQYMPDTGLIYLDINAGAETAEGVEAARAAGTLGNAMVTSLSHELTHAIERGSKQGYIDFKQAMIDQFKKRGGPTFEQLVQQKIGEQYANFGIRLTRQAAEAEVVAYGAELMLQNSDVIATLKPSLAEKVRTFIADFLKKVRNAFSIMPSLSTESSALVEMRDGVLKYADDLQKKWNIALQEAVGMEGEAVAAAAQEQTTEAAPAVAEAQTAEAAPAVAEAQTETADTVQPTTSEEAPLATAEAQALQSEEAPPSLDMVAALDGQDQPAGQSEALNEGSKAQATDGSGALYSMRSMAADADLYRGMLRAAGVVETEITTLFNTIDVAMDFIAQHPELDFTDDVDPASRSFSPVKPNSDSLYKVSIDFSTLCRKRLLQQTIQERLEAKYKTTISKAQRIAIRNALIQLQHEKKQIEVACGLCYVESARLKSPEQVAKFLANRRFYIVDYLSKKNKAYAAEIKGRAAELTTELGYEAGTTKKKMSKADADALTAEKRRMYAAYSPTAAEEEMIQRALELPDTAFTTAEGLRKLKREMPEIFDAYTTRIRNATKSKGIEAGVSWRAGDSASIADSLIETMNAENGLRSQSWSDFQVIHLLDYIAATIELSTRNAKIQTYTKVADFVRLMGHTGWMINMSLIPRNYNGETLEFDPVEGMDYEEAMELRDQFPDTAGVIAIGISDPQIRAMMENDNIDYIIPYHRSSLDKTSRAQMGLGLWDNYEQTQNEKKKDYDGVTNPDGEMYHKKPKFSEWFDYATVSARAKKVGAKQAMQEAAQRYIQLCHERGLQEKFPQFAEHPGYWKLLIDRKMINQRTGEIIEQRAVQPTFDQDTIIDIMQRESDRFAEFTRQADEAASVIEQMWEAGEIQKAAKAKNVRDMVKSFDDSVIINTIVESAEDLPASTGAQYSMRGRGDSITVREYVGTLEATESMTESERKLLDTYQATLKKHQEISEAISEIESQIREGLQGDSLSAANNRLGILREQLKRVARDLSRYEGADGFARLMYESRRVVSHYLSGRLYDSVASATEAIDSELLSISSDISELNRQLEGMDQAQRAAYARTLFDPKKLGDAAAKIKEFTGTRMSAKRISDRLALALSSVYSDSSQANADRLFELVSELATEMMSTSKFRYHSDTLGAIANAVGGAISLTSTQRQELKHAGISMREFRSMLSPYIRVAEGASDLSAVISSGAYYGDNYLESILGEDNEGNLVIRLYEVFSRERAAERESSFSGMNASQTSNLVIENIFDAVSDLRLMRAVGADKTFITNLRKVLADNMQSTNNSSEIADRISSRIRRASRATNSVWSSAVDVRTAATATFEYYSKVEEFRRKNDLLEETKRIKEQLQTKAAEQLVALRQHYEDRIERDRTRRQIMEESRKKERHVKKVVRRLHDKLVNERDTRNIKEPLKPVAIKLVNAFLEGFGRSVFSAQSTAKLYPLYQELAREAGVDTTEFASDISELFEILNETAVRYGEYASHGGNSIEQATLRLQIFDTLADIVDHVDALVRNADATFADGKRTTISLLSDSVYESLADRKNKRTIRGVVGKATQLFNDTTWMGNLLPTYFFEQLGNETLNDLFVDIRRGMSDSMRIVRDAQDFMQDLKKRKHYYSWRLGDTIDIHTAQGHDLHLPVEVAIALYVTAKRERTNTIAATRHLQDGGFRMDEDAAKKGLFNPAETSGFHRMSDEDIARLESLLTEDQKSYGDEIATYLAEHMGALGNQVSMATYGIRKYKESYYIPFVTASIQRAQSSSKGSTATTDDSRLAHQSFSHRLRTGANTALQIGNITDMALRHVYSMANYVGMATPIENLNRVLNHNIEAEDGSKSTIRAIFEQKYGNIALKYLEDLMRDVNGTTQSDNRSMGGINFLISAFKRGAVAGKLTVALQQPTAIFRAAAYLGIRDFVGIPVARVPNAWQELLKYSGTAIAKDMGRYDIGLGQTAVEYMAQDDMTGFNIFQRVQNRTVKENWKSFTDLTTALPGFMDQFAWVNIFAMVKREQARLHPGMDTSSEEFLKMCGERFDDVVYHTQVFDSVLSRSSLMRSKNVAHMAATSFMAEPTMTANMLRSAFFGKHTKAERAKIVAGCLVSTIGAAAAAALVGGFNKDDDDRTWWEKYLNNFTSRAIDGLNPMSLFPYFNAVSDYFEGYEAERLDTAVIGDMISHGMQAINGNLTPWKTVELLGGDIANLFGLPLGGVMGDVRRIRNAINSSKASVSADELKFSVLEAAPYGWYKGGTTAYYERMATAAINGDKAEVQAIRNYMLRAYQLDGEKIDSEMKSAMKDRFVSGDVPEGDAINLLVSYGLAKDKNDAYWTVDRWEHKAETGSDDGYGKYNDFTEAVRTGKNLKSVTSTYLNNGVTKSTLAGRITDAFDEEYVQLYKTDKRAAAALKARLLTAYELLGYDRTRKSKDIDKWVKD